MKLLQELFAKDLISEEKKLVLERETGKNGKTEEQVILENKIIGEDELFELKSKIGQVPFQKIKAEEVSADVLELIPEEAAINYKMQSFGRKDKLVMVGMVYPEDISAQNALRFLANQGKFSYHIFLITPSNFNNLLKQRRTISSETKEALDELDKKREKNDSEKEALDSALSEEAPVIKMVFVILRHAIEGGASDIHIEPNREKLTVRFRLNGILHPSLFLPLKVHPSIVARIKIMSGLKIDETRMPQDGRFTSKINGQDIDFRVATFPTLYGEKIELRVLDSSAALKSFDQLGLAGRNLEVVKEAVKKPYGMILFTGPTGSGKTTTQYAILRLLNNDSVNIVTVEDPIEYSIPGVNQSQVKPEIGYTFAQGLRQILRQDPNVIMVGEIRDEETASLAINAALTGHIVLSTLHTNSSVGVVARLVDMGVRPFLIPSTLRIVISQRLIRVLCEKCKIKVKPQEKIRDLIREKIKDAPDSFYVYEHKGCEECNFSGYSGRMALYEVLSMNDEIAEIILQNPSEAQILKAAQKQGMLTMEQEGILKVLEGKTTVEEITRVTAEK